MSKVREPLEKFNETLVTEEPLDKDLALFVLQLKAALNAAIDRINDLEQLITSHDHQHPYAGILDQLKNAAPEPKKGEHGE